MGQLVFDEDIIVKTLNSKRDLEEKLKSSMSIEDYRKAREDWHAKRKPIPCGMTIHTGIGCSYGCLYCYIYDMGFPPRPEPYPLTGLQLAHALALNPHFIPGFHGTLLAFGSVTEPFLGVTASRTFEYLRALRDSLGNPQQISTKSVLDERGIDEFSKTADPMIDVLVTITTIRHAKTLEPGAPSPTERLEFASQLVKRGFHVTLFMRPIIPGITVEESRRILEEALSHGIKDVIPGTLRVTTRILERLKASRIVDIEEIRRRTPRPPENPRVQVTIKGSDLKEAVIREARKLGLRVHSASCSSNIYSHKQACAACPLGPCGDIEKLPHVEETGVRRAARILGVKIAHVKIEEYNILVKCEDRRENCDKLKHYIIALARRNPVIKY